MTLTDWEALAVIPPRVADKIDIVTDWDCWRWTGATTGGALPYGVTWDGRRRVKAHRFMYEAANDVLPPGMVPDHLCKNTLCVRPSHLEAVTVAENIRRGDAPGPLAVRTNRCKRGHEFTPENTRIRKNDGGRTCLACERMHHRASKERARQRRQAA